MTDVMQATPAQVLAAQLLAELLKEDGQPVDDAILAIANARAAESPSYALVSDSPIVRKEIPKKS